MPALASPRDDSRAVRGRGRYDDGGGYQEGYYENTNGGYDEGYRSNGYDESQSYRDSGFDAYESYRGGRDKDKGYRDQYDDDGHYDKRHGEGEYGGRDYPPLPLSRGRRDGYDDYDGSEAYDDYTADYSLPQHGTDDYPAPQRGSSYGSGRQSNDFSVQEPDMSYANGSRRRKQRDPSVAGSVAPENGDSTLGSTKISGDVNYSGAISTMSASAITFDTHSSAGTYYTSKRSRSTKSKSTQSGEHATRTADRHQVIPLAVTFPKKEAAVEEDGERSAVSEKVDEISANLRRYIGHDEGNASPVSRKSARSRGSGGRDDPSAQQSPRSSPRSQAKPRPVLRNPDAAKSRETMKGRGKSSRSVASSAQRSRRSRSREMHREKGARDLMDGGVEHGGRRSMSRGRATRQLNSADGYDRRDERRRNRSRGDRSVGGDASVKSSSTHSSWRSIRHDVDEEGYCVHHPDVRLVKLKKDGNWRVIRKKCPECILEDCPRMLGHVDERSRVSKSEQRRKHHVSSSDIYHVSERGDFDASKSMASSAAPSSMGALGTFHELGLSFQTPEEMEEEEATNRLKRRLAARAYHFPGNTWCQDWMQYLSNTHTVLGLFFHHPLHPMGFQERLVILFGSIAIGLTISNFTYLYFIRNGIDVEEEVFTLNSRHTDMTGIPVVSITKLMITLWTLGSFLHTCFDLGLWHMKACTLCRYRGRVDQRIVMWGRVAGLFIVMVAMGAGGYAVLLRASIEYKGEGSVADEVEESIQGNELYTIEFEDKRSFRFLLGYLVEFVLALFVYYPLAVTILFSGVLGCGGRIPILGGRPREMAKEKRYEMNQRRPKILKAHVEEENGETVASTTDVVPISFRDDESREWFDENEVI